MSNAIVSLFNSIDVQASSRLSPADLAVCQHQEQLYKEAIELLSGVSVQMKEMFARYKVVNDRFIEYSDGYLDRSNIRYIEDQMQEIRKSHISKICMHFEKKYKVSLDEAVIIRKYKDTPLEKPSYEEIVEEIFVQLGGFPFEEKAVQELKDNCASHIYREPEIKGTRLILNNFIYMDSWEVRISWQSQEKVFALFKALSHFESGRVEWLYQYSSLANNLRDMRAEAYQKHEFGSNQVQAIRFFRNGKTEITFETYEQAQAFKKDYCLKG